MISFRVGADDAGYLAKYFEPSFEAPDLVKLNNQNIFITMSIDGEKSIPFSAHTLRMPEPENDQSVRIVELSRHKFSSERSQVEIEIADWASDGKRPAQPAGVGAAATATEPVEQKPNTFIGGLKNPQYVPSQGQGRSHGGGRGGQGSNRQHGSNQSNRSQQQPGGSDELVGARTAGQGNVQPLEAGQETTARNQPQ